MQFDEGLFAERGVSGDPVTIVSVGLLLAFGRMLICIGTTSRVADIDARAWAADEPSPVGSNSDLRTAAVERRHFALCSTCLRVGHRSRQDLDSDLHSRIGSCYGDRVGQDRVESREAQEIAWRIAMIVRIRTGLQKGVGSLLRMTAYECRTSSGRKRPPIPSTARRSHARQSN